MEELLAEEDANNPHVINPRAEAAMVELLAEEDANKPKPKASGKAKRGTAAVDAQREEAGFASTAYHTRGRRPSRSCTRGAASRS